MSQNTGSVPKKISADMAWSVLFESLARIFSYPQPTFYDGIQNGQLFQLLEECLSIIGLEPSLIDSVNALNQSLQQQTGQFSLQSLEPEYIGLFELNRDEPPLHLNAHLYEPQQSEQLALQHHLNALYRDGGLAIKAGQAADHLCVELNFVAWLYRQSDSTGDKSRYHKSLHDFQQQLLWIKHFAQQLQERHHWFYSPMSQLLVLIIEQSFSWLKTKKS